MIDSNTRLRVNEDEIAAEVVESETVLINLSTGTYYTMDNVGSVVWSMIERSHSIEEIGSRLATHYSVDPDPVLADLCGLVHDLLDQRLVLIDEDASQPAPSGIECSAGRSGYIAPTLNKYTDMAEVLALDPPLPVLKE